VILSFRGVGWYAEMGARVPTLWVETRFRIEEHYPDYFDLKRRF
jgi:hypothetical protein